ncbi:NAD-dependent epimerase/dehydratase family protein [Bradyrhizobium zhanjiangense]|uniref:NAD-dependent epimerase/dehydratase family protein n=1 Tax=Bradyrhizobium zhanjiangense TaxID=1325107 RepID=A0A4Q0QHF4_9BRAD|nr:NAD-dependent epimerase/dehydratase family protein [Bradyrhizobium zhanjiangense]RXG91926.1 NAD-dependent epimerase/dehydratase family protein [Bradyrhizobium zhanjiangense]
MDLKGKRVLVTGGAGFIGSHIVDLLCDEGCVEIVALDNMTTGRPENLRKSLNRGPVRLVRGDLRDTKLVEALVKGANIIFHHAAPCSTHCMAEPRLAMEVMVNGTFDLLELCVKYDVEKLIAASSASVYGAAAEELPTTEHQNPYGNRTVYGTAKVCNEGLLRAYNDMHGLDYIALRYFDVYGSRMDVHGRYAEMLIRWMDELEAGTPPVVVGHDRTLDLVHVRDAARATILAARAKVSDEVFNVGSGIETSLVQLASALASVMGHHGALPQIAPEHSINPVPRRVASTGKTERLLGFQITVPLELGLTEFVKWWRSERGLATARQRQALAS